MAKPQTTTRKPTPGATIYAARAAHPEDGVAVGVIGKDGKPKATRVRKPDAEPEPEGTDDTAA
jgi:hypothetical protein